MTEKILIIDFGSQVTQLIGRRLRELNVYCEIHPFNKVPEIDGSVKGIILSGSPCSVRDAGAPQINLEGIKGVLPVLGICYGAQYLAHKFGGEVAASAAREYGRALLTVKGNSPLFEGMPEKSQVWMSHGDTITRLPEGGEVIASTEDVVNAAYHIAGEDTYAVQFHPEVFHTTEGSRILANFALKICGCHRHHCSSPERTDRVRQSHPRPERRRGLDSGSSAAPQGNRASAHLYFRQQRSAQEE